MGSFQAGKWIIGISIYFFLFFLVMHSIVNSKGLLSTEDNRLVFTDPGFSDQTNIFLNNSNSGVCDDFSVWALENRAMTFTGNVLCDRLPISTQHECTNVSGCNWVNITDLVPSFCSGFVNKTHFNITGGHFNYCSSTTTFQNNVSMCLLFNCVWHNTSVDDSTAFDVDDAKSVSTIWQTITFMFKFRADVGLGSFNFIFLFLFVWLPFIVLIWSIFMAIPFFH